MDDVNRALSISVSQTKKLVKHFAKGNTGSNASDNNEAKQLNQLRRAISGLAIRHKRKVITYREIRGYCGNYPVFKNDKNGVAQSIKRGLDELRNMGMLSFGEDPKHGKAYTIIDGGFFSDAPEA